MKKSNEVYYHPNIVIKIIYQGPTVLPVLVLHFENMYLYVIRDMQQIYIHILFLLDALRDSLSGLCPV